MKAIKQDGMAQSSTRSQFLWDEMDLEKLTQESFNEWDQDCLNKLQQYLNDISPIISFKAVFTH